MNPQVTLLKKSATLKITALTKKLIREGKDVVNFAAGEPDFDTPDFVKEGGINAINQGFTKYTPSVGYPELRAAIADKLNKVNKLSVSSENIIVTTGAKYAIYVSLLALLDSGDEVIMSSPYWVSYPEMVNLTSGKSVFLQTKESNNFKIDPQTLSETITPRTKVLILNYPNNPTGITYSYNELKEIYNIVKEKNIHVISDEIYETLIYDEREHVSFASFPGADKFTITINGFSKSHSMTGWRIGYLSASEETINEISKIIDHTTSCASSITQRAALAALTNENWQRKIKLEFQKRRDVLYKGLSDCDKLNPIKPEGTFYMFCDIRETGLSSFDFSTKLLEEYLVSCIPASSFGMEGYIRISFSTGLEQISKGLKRIKDFVKSL